MFCVFINLFLCHSDYSILHSDCDLFKDTKAVIRGRKFKTERQCNNQTKTQPQKTNMYSKSLHRKLNIKQHEQPKGVQKGKTIKQHEHPKGIRKRKTLNNMNTLKGYRRVNL